jgi:putative hydrolase of the HAD superfamily
MARRSRQQHVFVQELSISSAVPIMPALNLAAAPPLKTILFDMGNVLVFFCHEKMCRQIGELCGRTSDEVRAHLLDSELQWEFERGLLSEELFKLRLEALLGHPLNSLELQHAAGNIFELNETIVPVLDALKSQGLRLVLLSNTCLTHVKFIRQTWNVLDRFDQLVVSYEAGAIKPEDRIYEAALRAIECEPSECLYFDDIAAYVEKGRTLGLRAEVFTTTEQALLHLRQHGVELFGR